MTMELTGKQIMDIINKVVADYISLYKQGAMGFSEYAIIENIVIKIQIGIDNAIKEGEDDGDSDS